MKRLLELEKKLRDAKEQLEKNAMMGYDNMTGMPPGTAGGDIMDKKEHKDEKEDKKMIEEKLDEHNEEKHGEPKDEDSAKKSEVVKFEKNGQWSLNKAIVVDQKPDGEYDVPVKEVYDGDDKFKEVGGKSVDGDKGKTVKVSEHEKKQIKDL